MHTLYSLISWQWPLILLASFAAIWLCWYIPGSWFIRRFGIKSLSLHYVLATVLGMVLWTGQAFLFGWLDWRWSTYLLVGASLIWVIKHYRSELMRLRQLGKSLFATPWWLKLLASIGTVVQLIPVFGTGTLRDGAAVFYGVNAYDGILHLAFIQNMVRAFPPEQPGAAGLLVTNYHYWSDLAVAELVRVWHLPIATLFFQVMPLFLSLLTATALYHLAMMWTQNKTVAGFALFFQYAAGDLGYAMYWLLHRTWFWDISAIDNGATQFVNMPHSFAKLVFISLFITGWYWLKTNHRRWQFLTIFLGISLVGFKIYYAFAFALGWGFLMMAKWIDIAIKIIMENQKTQISRVRATLPSLIVDLATTAVIVGCMLAIFLPVNQSAGGLFFAALEWPKLFLSPSNLDFANWWARRAVYQADHNTIGLLALDGIAIVVGLLCVHGTRVLGFALHKGMIKKLGLHYLSFTWLPIVVLTVLGLFTLQESGTFNVFNFLVVTTIPLSLISAWWLADLWQRHLILGKLAVIVVVLLTLPRVVFETGRYSQAYITNKYEQRVAPAELAAYEYMRRTIPDDALLQSSSANGWDLNAPYLAFFTGKRTYLTGVKMLESHNQPIANRQAAFKQAVTAKSAPELAGNLRALKIEYYYFTPSMSDRPGYSLDSSEVIIHFDNSGGTLIQVKPQ